MKMPKVVKEDKKTPKISKCSYEIKTGSQFMFADSAPGTKILETAVSFDFLM